MRKTDRRARILYIVTVSLLMLSDPGNAAPLKPEQVPAFTIPRISKPPVIDGKIDPLEWRESVAISGVAEQGSNSLIPRPTTFYLAWDPGHLYLACRTWVMPGYKPVPFGREEDKVNAGDDGLELHFQPQGKNLPQGGTENSYKFFINCLGFGGDKIRVSVGQLFRNWLPSFKAVSRTTEPGTAPKGGRWLEWEVSFTPEDFELVGAHQAGDKWKMMLGFNHMPIWIQARIPANSGYFDPGGYCVATLAEKVPAVQFTMDDLPGPCDGQAAVKFSAYNPAKQAAQLKVLALFSDAAGDMVRKEQTLDVGPEKSAEYIVNEALPRNPKDGSISYRVTQGDLELLRYFTFFSTSYPKNYMTYEPPKEPFPLNVGFNPVRSNFQITGDRYFLKEPEKAVAMRYQLMKEGDVKPVREATVAGARTDYFTEFVQLQPLAEGKYTVEASLETAVGGRIGPNKCTFEKLNEAKAFSEWWDNKLGNIERVVPPFSAMTLANSSVSLWGRSYALNAVGLPDSISSQNEQILASPARIVAVVDGKETPIPLNGKPKFTDTKAWRVAFSGKAQGAGIDITTEGWVEQDGLAYLQLTYAPQSGKAVTVDALRIEFPIAAKAAECLLCIGNGGNYSTRTAKLLPEKEGRVWQTLDMGRVGSGMTVGSFFPLVWLGNEQRGLLWWGDNDCGWIPKDDVSAHEVVRQGGTVILRNNIIGVRVTLDGPRTISFGYMASPFRPLVKGWRSALGSQDGTFNGPHKDRKDPKTGKDINGWNWISPPSTDPTEWNTLWSSYKALADKKVQSEQPFSPYRARNGYYVHTSLPLQGSGYKTGDQRVINYFNPEWGGDCYTPSNTNYYLYLIDRAIREGGLRTIYWDIFFPSLRSSIQNGTAYQLPDGRIQPGYCGFNIRRFLMRAYSLMDEHGLMPGGQVVHATNAYLLVAAPWVDAILDGEYHQLTDNSAMDWVDGYSVEHMRALANGHNWGAAISWMDHIKIKDKDRAARVRRGLQDYVRLYDAWQGPSHGLPQTVIDWGINREDVEYVPFWRNPHVKCDDPKILVSIWKLPDRVMLCAFNYDDKAGKDAMIKIDLKALGLLPQRPWQDFIAVRDLAKDEKEPVSVLDFQSATLKVPGLRPHTGRLVGIILY